MHNSNNESFKNYYQLLGLDKDADEKQIKTAYRRLALTYHPDKNPGNRIALEKFKKITEAYGVLIDPVKRKEYDLFLSNAERLNRMRSGFGSYRYADILSDIFNNPRAKEVFDQMNRGDYVRMDERFLRDILAGGFLFGGVFYGFWGLFPFRAHTKEGRTHFGNSQIGQSHILGSLMDRFKTGFFKTVKQVKDFWDSIETEHGIEEKRYPSFHLEITHQEAIQGTAKIIKIKTEEGIKKYKIKIPSGIKDGVSLKIKDRNLKPYYLIIKVLEKQR